MRSNFPDMEGEKRRGVRFKNGTRYMELSTRCLFFAKEIHYDGLQRGKLEGYSPGTIEKSSKEEGGKENKELGEEGPIRKGGPC